MIPTTSKHDDLIIVSNMKGNALANSVGWATPTISGSAGHSLVGVAHPAKFASGLPL